MLDAENVAVLCESCLEKLHSFLAEARRMEELLANVNSHVSNHVWRKLMDQRQKEIDALDTYYQARNRLFVAARPQSTNK